MALNLLNLGDELKKTFTGAKAAVNQSPFSFFAQNAAPAIQQRVNTFADSVGNSIRPVASPLPQTNFQKVSDPIRNIVAQTVQDTIKRLPGETAAAVKTSPPAQLGQYIAPLLQFDYNKPISEQMTAWQTKNRNGQFNDLFKSLGFVGEFIPVKNAVGGVVGTGIGAVKNVMGGKPITEDYAKNFSEGYRQSAQYGALGAINPMFMGELATPPLTGVGRPLAGQIIKRAGMAGTREAVESGIMGFLEPDTKSRIKNAADQAMFGFVTGALFQSGGDISGQAIKNIANQTGKTISSVRGMVNHLNTPITLTKIDPDTGKRVTMPLWKHYLTNQQGGFVDFNAEVKKPNLRKARPGSYTNVPEIDNPLVAKVNNQMNQMQPVSTVRPGELQPTELKPFSNQNVQTAGVKQAPVESGQQQQAPSGQTGQGGSSLPPQKTGSSNTIIPPKTNSFIQAIKDKANTLYTESIDRFNPLSQLAKTAKKDQAMRNALTGHYGAGSTANYHVDYELTPILKEQNIDELRRAAIAMRDVELQSRDIKGSNTGDPVKALEALNTELGPEKMKSLGDTLKKLYAYQDSIVKKYLVETGVISEDSYKAMRKNNQFYVPFKRVMDQVDDFLGFVPQTKQAGSVSGQNVVFKIKGSDKEIVDPIESIIESTYKSVGLGMRQKVARTIVDLRKDLPEGMITKIEGNVGNKPNVSLFENGKVVHYAVPPEVADAAKGLSEESLNTIVKILSLPTKVFRASATGINPEFMAPNVVRDLQSAFVNAGLNPMRWVQGFAHQLKKDEVYQEFLKSGGKTSRISIDRPMLKKTVGEISGKGGLSIADPRKLLNVLQTMGEYSEQPTRIAVFEKYLNKGLKEGLSREEAAIRAANMAQEATVNFGRRGSKTQSINAIYAFLNARAQGVDRLVRTIKNDPKGASIRIGMITAAPALALYSWNRNFNSYNDDRVVSEADRKSNYIIMLSDTPIKELGGAQYIKIAKGDIGRLANPMEEFLSYADNKGGDVKKALFDSLKSFMPLDNVGDIIPTAVRPLAELKANKNFFFNSEIIPGYKENLPPAYQDTSYTSPIYRMIGQKLNVSPAQIQHVVEGYGTGLAKIGEMVTRPLIPQQYRSTKNDQGASINKTPIIRRFLGGERKTMEEQNLSNQKAQESLKFKINDVKGAINRGDIPMEAGRKQIEKLQSQYKTPQGSETKGSMVYFMDNNGKYKEIDTSFQPTAPKLTGQTELDKKAISKFNGEITSKANDIYDLYKAGKLTEQEAEKALTDLKALKSSYGSGGKLKKITFSKVTAKPIKIALPKARKMASIKLSRPLKPKLAKLKKMKAIVVKPIKVAKLKGLTVGTKLV